MVASIRQSGQECPGFGENGDTVAAGFPHSRVLSPAATAHVRPGGPIPLPPQAIKPQNGPARFRRHPRPGRRRPRDPGGARRGGRGGRTTAGTAGEGGVGGAHRGRHGHHRPQPLGRRGRAAGPRPQVPDGRHPHPRPDPGPGQPEGAGTEEGAEQQPAPPPLQRAPGGGGQRRCVRPVPPPLLAVHPYRARAPWAPSPPWKAILRRGRPFVHPCGNAPPAVCFVVGPLCPTAHVRGHVLGPCPLSQAAGSTG